VVLAGLVGRQLVYGLARNAVLRWQAWHMTSKFNAKIEISAGKKTKAIFKSLETDNKFYDENPTKTKMDLDKEITILIEAQEISNLRANLNSTLRLVQASNDSLESVKI
jgi:KEOPS complex subunit Pcc1